jgi:hypothetical protein
MTTAERLFETVRRLPEPLTLELLDFAEFLERKHQTQADHEYAEARQRALSLMATGYDLGGKGISDREELHER